MQHWLLRHCLNEAESYLCAMFYRWLFFFCTIPFLLKAQTKETTHAYQENELWGLRDLKPITPAVYDTIIAISNSPYFIAKKHRGSSAINSTGVISAKGKAIIPFSYLQIIPSTSYYIINKWEHNKLLYAVVSASNKMVLPLRFTQIKRFNNYWIAKSNKEGLSFYNLDGRFLKQVNADSAVVSANSSFLKIFKEGKIGILDAQLKQLFPPQYKTLRLKNGTWETESFEKWQLIANNDTLTFNADSVRVWNKNLAIIQLLNSHSIYANGIPISKSYTDMEIVSPHFAITRKKNLWGAISKNGIEIMPPSFGAIRFSEGYFYTRSNHKWSVYDSLGKKRSVFKYDSIGSMTNGLFPVKRKGKWGFMNRDGKEIIRCIYDMEADFKQGKAIIKYFGASGIIDLQGNWVVKPKEENITDVSFNFYIYHKQGVYYLNNYAGELIYFTSHKLLLKNETIYEIRDGYAYRVSSLGRLINNKPIESEGSESWKIIKVGDKYGFENSKGLLTITYRYDSLLPFSEGLAAFKLRGKWGFINEAEDIAIQPLYDKVKPFFNKIAIINSTNKFGLVQPNGQFILKPKFKSILRLNNNLWLVEEKGLKGVYSSSGKVIIQSKYDQIYYVNNNMIIVMRNEKYGVVNFEGKSIIPRTYDYIGFDIENQVLILKQLQN